MPIKLPDDSLRDIITLIDYDNKEDLSLFKAEHITLNDNKIAPFTITKRYRLIRILKILLLAEYHGIDGGLLGNTKVKEAIINLYPVMKN